MYFHQWKRRNFITLLGGAMAAWPLAARAQQPNKVARIGRLSPLSISAEAPMVAGLRQGLSELGWIEGQNLAFEFRFADGNLDRLPQLADELVRANVDVIVTGSSPGASAAKNATSTIPIVMVTTGDPIQGGLVASLARPSGNLTGVTALGQVLNLKRLELLKEAVPAVKSVAVLTNPASPYTEPFLQESESGALALGIELRVLEAREPDDLERAFEAIVNKRAEALMVLSDPMFISQRRRIVEGTAKYRLPSIFGERGSVQAGGLMFYGANLPDMYRRAATYVDKILKGAKPADLPVEQPTTFELVINLKTAKALRLELPPALLARADEMIE
jgi:putative tryptophan/tyrosine transport system substrate-binding protein